MRERFHQLLLALGREFDGKIEGINLPETAVDFGETGRLYPKGFTPHAYRDAVVENMTALKRAFPKSVTLQYANFMPEEKGDTELRLPAERLRKGGRAEGRRRRSGPVAVQAGPDAHSYPLLREFAGRVPTGIAVQEGNYAHENPKTHQRVTIPSWWSSGRRTSRSTTSSGAPKSRSTRAT